LKKAAGEGNRSSSKWAENNIQSLDGLMSAYDQSSSRNQTIAGFGDRQPSYTVYRAIEAAQVYYLVATPPKGQCIREQHGEMRAESSATKSLFGWVSRGALLKWTNKIRKNAMKADKPKENISKMYFMEYDIKGDPKTSCPSIADKKALQLVRDSGRLTKVHYELTVPYRQLERTLPDSKIMSDRRFDLLKQRHLKDKDLRERDA